jgi:hypothetical protein
MDFFIGCTVFVLALSILFVYWTYSNNRINETNIINDITEKAYLISDIWFREGIPKYWDSSNVIDLGLSNNHRFNRTKMDSLNDPLLGYKNVSRIIGIEAYDYKFEVINSTKNVLYTFGSNPANPSNLVKIKRVGILDGNIVTVEVMVWA